MTQKEFVNKIEKNRGKLLRIARTMVRQDDCEDALQSAILSAWENLPQLRDEQAFDAWLTQILINRCRQIQRGYKKQRDIRSASVWHNPETQAPESDLLEAMCYLSDEERELFDRHHVQGYSIREMAEEIGKSEDVVKMRLYRARKHLKAILISLLLLVLLACAAIGTDLIDVDWFMHNRRAEPAVIKNRIVPKTIGISYLGNRLDVEISDAVWNMDALSVAFVYSVVGKADDALVIHSGNIGVDGVRQDHIWTDDGILPVQAWANGKKVQVFTLDGWQLGGMVLTGSEDCLPDGRGETFIAELYLDWIRPERYGSLLDENGMMTFEAELTLKDYEGGESLEAQKVVVRIDAPTPQEWRNRYEACDR